VTSERIVRSGPDVAARRSLAGRLGYRVTYGAWLWAVVLTSGAMFAGALLDAWSHVHVPSLDAIFNPWHWLVYGSFVALVAALGLPILGRLSRDRSLGSVIPRSYRTPIAGGVIFLLSGLADLAWHIAFGIEVGVEALLSPTHLGLAVGAAMLWSLPLQLAWRRRQSPKSAADYAPALVSAALLVGLILFSTHYVNLLVDPWPLYPFNEGDPRSWFVPSLGFAALIIPTAVVMGSVLLILRRWPEMPTGGLALLFVLSGSGLVFLHDMPALIVVPALTGVAAEVLRRVLRPFASRPVNVIVFAAAVPVCQAIAWLATIEVIGNIAWSIHLVAGLLVMAALTGALVSLLVLPPSRVHSSHSSAA
jgi:hypothetical protein